ncbi:prepilin peptidase [Candidatus Peribacteria bacterium]|nr:prepilin peptidase [Candidatus Peribacteria bacterium]
MPLLAPWLAYGAIGALGLLCGSFFGVLISRLYHGTGGMLLGRSQCDHCQHSLAWYELLPVVSYAWLGGRCRSCSAPLSVWYLGYELLTAGVFLLLYHRFGLSVTALPYWISGIFALLLGLYDAQYMVVDRRISLPAIAWAAVFLVFWSGLPWQMGLLGGGIGAGFYALQYGLSRGRWVGEGDIDLGLYMGLSLGYPVILAALFGAYWVGFLAVIPLLLRPQRTRTTVPMGGFLMLSYLVMLCYGPQILAWYWGTVLGF